jgi:HNH endonuclease
LAIAEQLPVLTNPVVAAEAFAAESSLKWCNAGKHFVPQILFSKNLAKRDGLQVRCKPCQANYQKLNAERISTRNRLWRAENRDEKLTRRKLRYRANLTAERARARAWQAANREKMLLRKRADYRARRQFHLAQKKLWRISNPELATLRRRQNYERVRGSEQLKIDNRRRGKTYYSRHPERVKAKAHRRRHAVGNFTDEQWLAKCEFWGWRCYLCGCALTLDTTTIDHRKPLVWGGANWVSNLAPACAYCNAAKKDRSEPESRARLAAGLTKVNPATVPVRGGAVWL